MAERETRSGGGHSRGPRDRDKEGGGGKFRRFRRKKVCIFCKDPEIDIDFKQLDLLKRYVSDRGRIFPRRRSGNCAKHQRAIAECVKKARFVALLPYVAE